MVRPAKDLEKVLTILFLLELSDNCRVFSLRVKAIQDQTTVSGQRHRQGLQRGLPLVLVPFVSEVDGDGPLWQSELRGRAEAQLRRQFAFNGGGTLELIVDLDAHPPPSLFELC